MNDPVVQEIRKIREGIVEECRKSGVSIMAHLKAVQAGFQGRIIKKKPLPRKKRAAA